MSRQKGDGKGRLGGKGRVKGTPNKKTAQMREFLAQFANDNREEAIMAWHRIEEPKEKFKLWLEAVAYNTPKLSAIELKGDSERKAFREEVEELMKESEEQQQ